MNSFTLRFVNCGILLVFTCCGCASPPLGKVKNSGGLAVSSAFTINLYCLSEDEHYAGIVSAQEDLPEPDVSNQPVPLNAESEEDDSSGSCNSLVESMRNGAEDLLTKAKFERALSY